MEVTIRDGKTYALLTDLTNWDQNPRSITDDGFARLCDQIRELGQYKPLICTPHGVVLGGNMRLRAMQALAAELTLTEAWVSIVNPRDESEMMKYSLSDNDRAGFYDDSMLANIMPNYDIDWGKYSVDLSMPRTIDSLPGLDGKVEQDEPPAVDSGDAISIPGEIYQLGSHRLLCGDATKLEDIARLMVNTTCPHCGGHN